MKFMEEMRAAVSSIEDAVSAQGERIVALETSQQNTKENTPKTTKLYAAIGFLIGLLLTLLISYQQIRKDYVEYRQEQEQQKSFPRGNEGGI